MQCSGNEQLLRICNLVFNKQYSTSHALLYKKDKTRKKQHTMKTLCNIC